MGKVRATIDWSEAETALLTELRMRGLTKAEIAARLTALSGHTRTHPAVGGKIARLEGSGVVFPPLGLCNQAHLKVSKGPERTPRSRVRPETLAPLLKPCGSDTRPADACQWPSGDRAPFAWCGRLKTTGPYCAAHTALARGTGTPSERAAARVLTGNRIIKSGGW